MARLLIAEDEERMRRLLAMLLSNAQHDLELAANGAEALELYRDRGADVVITDLRMPVMGGLELIEALRSEGADVPIIVITAFGSIDSAVDAMRAGANDYITKPFEEARIKLAIEKALGQREMLAENRALRRELRSKFAFEAIVAESRRMLDVLDTARQVAAANTTVMVYGESGVGKELVTRAIHEASPRCRGPFVAINCAAIPDTLLESELFGHERGSFTGATDAKKGKFELADGGTLFLDEIGEMAPALQAKMLRALETQSFERVGGTKPIRCDIRFLAATNKNLRQKVAKGEFRDDLFYRLNVFPLMIPPLRDRVDDIIPLTEHFLARFAGEMGKQVPAIAPDAADLLVSHAWHGNVRELQNVIERSMILIQGGTLTAELLHMDALEGLEAMAQATERYEREGPSLGPSRNGPKGPAPKPKSKQAKAPEASDTPPDEPRWRPFRIPEVGFDLENHERELIEQALERAKNNKSAAAKLLGLSRATLRYRLEKFGIGAQEPASKS